jgi:hypothetical protein
MNKHYIFGFVVVILGVILLIGVLIPTGVHPTSPKITTNKSTMTTASRKRDYIQLQKIVGLSKAKKMVKKWGVSSALFKAINNYNEHAPTGGAPDVVPQ